LARPERTLSIVFDHLEPLKLWPLKPNTGDRLHSWHCPYGLQTIKTITFQCLQALVRANESELILLITAGPVCG
jgi:hypothetical protein